MAILMEICILMVNVVFIFGQNSNTNTSSQINLPGTNMKTGSSEFVVPRTNTNAESSQLGVPGTNTNEGSSQLGVPGPKTNAESSQFGIPDVLVISTPFPSNIGELNRTTTFYVTIQEDVKDINALNFNSIPCYRNTIKVCIDNLMTFLSEDSPHFVPAKDLDVLCLRAKEGQKCMKEYLDSSTCIIREDKDVFETIIERSVIVTNKICDGDSENLSYQKAYRKTTDCINKHVEEISVCMHASITPADYNFQIDDMNMTNTQKYTTYCCPMVYYIQCTGKAIQESCDEEAKYVVSELLTSASGVEFNGFCKSVDAEYPHSTYFCSSASAVEKLGKMLFFAALQVVMWFSLLHFI